MNTAKKYNHDNCCQDDTDIRIRNNKIVQFDPTRTLSLRKRFMREMDQRLNKLKRLVFDLLVTQNFLQPDTPLRSEIIVINAEYNNTAAKVESFMRWLKEQEDAGILQTSFRSGTSFTRQPWSNVFIQSAYQKGIQRAQIESKKAGFTLETPPIGGGLGTPSFNNPFHIDRVGLLYTRTFNDLKGITNEMDKQISRVLSQGMIEGKSPRTIARDINNRIDKIGITRARTLARTEIIRAHHQANINEFELAGVEKVTVLAEWVTAGFRVCPLCQFNEGEIFKLSEIRGLIPLHPNCRCVAVPIVVDPGKRQKVTGEAAIGFKKGGGQVIRKRKFGGKRSVKGKG